MLDQYFVAIQVEGSWELVRPPSPSYKLKSFKQVQQICSESNRIVFRELVCLFVLKKLPNTSEEVPTCFTQQVVPVGNIFEHFAQFSNRVVPD